MKFAQLTNFKGGWFVGNFEPSLFKNPEAEVAIKHYRAGDTENLHYHHVATEITAVLNGHARMGDRELGNGDIIVLEPGEGTAFEALTDVTTVVVKVPSLPDDKYDYPPAL